MLKSVYIIFSILFVLIIQSHGQAVGDYGSRYAASDWATANNWVICVTAGTWTGATNAVAVPTAAKNVWVRSGHTVTMSGNSGACNNINIQGTLSNAVVNRALNVSGNVTNSGTFNYSASGSSVTIAGNLFNTGTITISSGTFTVSGTSDFSGGSFSDNNNNGANTFSGLITISNTASWTTTSVTTAANLDIRGGLIHGGTSDFAAGGATFTTNAQSIQLNSNGNISFGAGNSNLNINKDLILKGTGTGSFNYSGTGTFLLAAGVTITNQRTVNIDGYINGSNATTSVWINDANSILNYTNATAPFTGLGILNASVSGNTINYNRAGVQIMNACSYYNLTVSNGGVKSLSGNVSVNNTLLFNTDNTFISLGNYNLTLSATNTITNSSSLRYVMTDGSGSLVKQGNSTSDFQIIYPIGSGGYYTPMSITNLTALVNPSASISVHAVPIQRIPSTSALNKYWSITTTNLSSINADVSFKYDATEVEGTEVNYVTRRFDGSSFQIPENAAINTTTKIFSATGVSVLTGDWTAIDPDGETTVIDGPVNVFQGRTQVYTITPGNSNYSWAVSGGTIASGQGTNAIVITWDATTGSGNLSVSYSQNGFNVSLPALTVIRSVFPLSCFQYYRKIDIKGTMVSGGSLTNFPILVNVTDANLKSVANGGHVAHNAGYDIYFAMDASGSQPLEYQIDDYNPTTGQLVVWVKKASLTDSNSSIYIFYGNYSITFDASTSDVWGSDYTGVYHMSQSTGDFGLGCNDGINTGTSIVPGKIGQGRLLNRSEKDFIELTNEPSFNFGAQMTVSFWIKLNSYPAAGNVWMDYIVKGDNKNWRFVGNSTNSNIYFCFGNEYSDDLSSANNSVSIGIWTHIVGTFNGNNNPSPLKNLFVNGVKTTITANHSSIANYLTDNSPVLVGINSQAQDTRAFDGILDELRVSNQFKSDVWILAEYKNQSDLTNVSLSSSGEQILPIASVAIGGTASAVPSSLFAREYSSLTLAGHTGSVIQWQSSSDNVNFIDLTGKTSNPQQTDPLLENTYFRALVNNGGCPTASSSVLISVTPPYITCTNGKRKKITINDSKYVGSDNLENFPFLLQVNNDADLKQTPAGKVQSNKGWDIRFTSRDGLTLLPQQVESYDPVTGSILVWVQIPIIYATENTEIYMYYGDPAYAGSDPSISAAFGSEYLGVYHMGTGTGKSLFELNDASEKGNNAVNTSTTNLAGGKIGAASTFNGTSQYITLPNESQFDISNNGKLTLSAWVNVSAYSSAYVKYMDKASGSWTLRRNNGTSGVEMRQDYQSPEYVSTINSSGIATGSGWHYLVATYDHEVNNMIVYIDGSAAASSKNVPANQILQNNSNAVRIGADAGTPGNYFTGSMDEVRIQNVARTADWIKFEYDNMSSPVGFATISIETSCSLGAPTPGTASTNKSTLCIGQSATLTLTGYTGGIYWQKSTDNSHWSFITGANNATLNTGVITHSTYYRASVSNCCEAFSNVILITYVSSLPPYLSFSTTDVSCFGQSNGTINLTVTQGSGSYNYGWSNSATSQNISLLTPATYAVTVTDIGNNCSTTSQTTVNQPSVLAVSVSGIDETCTGSANGSATGTPSGGTSPYTYLWSNGNSTSNNTGLTSGSYSLTVTDSKTCTITSSATISTMNTGPPTTPIHHD